MISAGRASSLEVPGGIVLGGWEFTDWIDSSVAVDSWRRETCRGEDREVEGESRSSMILSMIL